jgi:hypothetical protein
MAPRLISGGASHDADVFAASSGVRVNRVRRRLRAASSASAAANRQERTGETFVGTTPATPELLQFMGAVGANAD